MSHWSSSRDDKRQVRRVLNSAEPDQSQEINATALTYGLFIFWVGIGIVLAAIVAAYIATSIHGPSASILFAAAPILAAPAGRALNRRNALRAHIRAQAR